MAPISERHSRIPYVIVLCAVLCAAPGWIPVSAQNKVPMPPTNLRIEITPNVQLVDKIFAREGISKDARSVIYNDLSKLTDGDLVAVAHGFDPALLNLAMPETITAESWAKLAPAYAEAIVSDRKDRREARRSHWDTVLSVVLTAILFVPSGMALQFWLERRKSRMLKPH